MCESVFCVEIAAILEQSYAWLKTASDDPTTCFPRGYANRVKLALDPFLSIGGENEWKG